MIIEDPFEIRKWLKKRNNSNLRAFSNTISRTVGFVDKSNADYIICKITSLIKDKFLYRKYVKINSIEHNDEGMFKYWISSIINLKQ